MRTDTTTEFEQLATEIDEALGTVLDSLNRNQPITMAVERLAELRVKVQQARGRVKTARARDAEPPEKGQAKEDQPELPLSFEAAVAAPRRGDK